MHVRTLSGSFLCDGIILIARLLLFRCLKEFQATVESAEPPEGETGMTWLAGGG